MKILLVATVQSHICQFHRPLVELLHEHGCIVHVAARNNLAEKNGMRLDFVEEVYDVPFSRSPISKNNITAYRQLKRIIDDGEYEVVHCNTPMGGVLTRLAGKKTRKKGTKLFYTAHGFHFYKGAPKKNWFVYYPIEKYLSRKCDKVITIVSEDFEIARKKFHSSVHRIHGVGVDSKRYYPISLEDRERLKIDMGYAIDQKIILCIGELLPNKNHDMAIKSMVKIAEEYPAAKLLIAGNGPDNDRLHSMVNSLGLQKNVDFLGYVLNLQEYQRVADVMVACSIREGLGLNVVEALMSGTPVVVSDNRGHRELIDGGRNGFMVSQNDFNGMAECVIRMFKNPVERNAFSQNAVAFAQRYSVDVVKKELEQIYEF